MKDKLTHSAQMVVGILMVVLGLFIIPAAVFKFILGSIVLSLGALVFGGGLSEYYKMRG